MSRILMDTGLVIEHNKSKVFHFMRSQHPPNPFLDLTLVKDPILTPKPIWRYLGFFFNHKLTFQYYVHHYANKWTEIEEGHDEIVEEVLKRLKKNNLYIKPEKCVWKVKRVGFLGVVIGPNGIEIEKEKVDGVLSWPTLKNVKDIRKFLDLTNYYRRFIKDFAKVARPMNMLTRKDVEWQWGEE